ncbi:MAG TPA: hypothetical protein VN493_30190 [Thermoanaerobaculia bacterium]|nr:hypothetical protein [Thermoanaerobaculia bacterium]
MEPGTGIPNKKKETSPWVYIGCGCAGLVILAMAGFSAMTWFAYRKGKEIEKTWTDPKAREEKAREVLVYDKLPEGYYPLGGISIPFVMDMAMIGDNPPPPGAKPDDHEGFRERGFMYFKMGRIGDEKEMRDYMEGKVDQPEWIKGNTDVDAGQVLRRGEVDTAGQKILYTSSRGKVNHNEREIEGITTMMMIDCPQDERVRFGLWFGPDPKPGEPAEKLDVTGTNADPEEIRRFASHFRFCR